MESFRAGQSQWIYASSLSLFPQEFPRTPYLAWNSRVNGDVEAGKWLVLRSIGCCGVLYDSLKTGWRDGLEQGNRPQRVESKSGGDVQAVSENEETASIAISSDSSSTVATLEVGSDSEQLKQLCECWSWSWSWSC